MQVTPTFATTDLLLRPFTKEDIPALHTYLNHPALTGRRYIPWDFSFDLPLSVQQVEKIVDKWLEMEDGFCFAVTHQLDQTIVGHAQVDWGWDAHMPECSVVIAPTQQRKGYGGQVLTLLLDYLYDFTIAHNISNWVSEWNTPALAFVKKYGFTQAGIVRHDEFRAGKFMDSIVFDILRPEWQARQAAEEKGA